MRGWWLLLVASCSFEVPSLGNAEQACIDWVDAARERAVRCGRFTEEQAKAVFQEWVEDRCSTVVWADSDEVYGKCIPEMLNTPCDVDRGPVCHGLGP